MSAPYSAPPFKDFSENSSSKCAALNYDPNAYIKLYKYVWKHALHPSKYKPRGLHQYLALAMMSSQRRHDGTDQNVQLGEDGGNASNAQDAHQLQDPQTSQGVRFCSKYGRWNGMKARNIVSLRPFHFKFHQAKSGWKHKCLLLAREVGRLSSKSYYILIILL